MITLYNEDALQRLKLIPEESIDLIISDVPYKVTSRGCSGTMGGGIGKVKKQRKV